MDDMEKIGEITRQRLNGSYTFHADTRVPRSYFILFSWTIMLSFELDSWQKVFSLLSFIIFALALLINRTAWLCLRSWLNMVKHFTRDCETIYESSSSSSDEDRKCFQSPSFSSTSHNVGFKSFGQKRQRSDSPLNDDAETNEPLAKKKLAPEDVDAAEEKAKRMMEKMGYKKGVGLGKHGQGRLEPVEASKQKGRRGLGHYNEKLREANLRWDPNEEVISVEEEIEWLDNPHQPPSQKELDRWMGIGPSKETIEDETLFCDPNVVSQVVGSKSVFDNLDKNEMRRARTRSNPFETIRGAFFLNRAAVKMANMDKACNFMFTTPKNLNPGELLYFADVCAGPGGFSEYVLWRKKWRAKGFGFTLKESNDFKLEDFYSASPETFHPYYGPNGDGDVYNPENQEAFRKLIMRHTRDQGVHFMMSDGGFSVEGQESIQEILSKQLYLCQCLVALMIVREGGHFVTKVFDLFTPFSAGLVYLMYRCFNSISIFKPNTSRPANSERYLICKGKHANVQDVIDYMARANRVILKKNRSLDVMDLVSHDVLVDDTNFYQYLKNSNDALGRKQIVGLLKIAAFCEDTTLHEDRQAEMREQCLKYWDLPDMIRMLPRNEKPAELLKKIMKNSTLNFMTTPATKLTPVNLDTTILNTVLDWFCMPSGSGRSNEPDRAATFYLGMGRRKTFRWTNGNWERVLYLELPANTLVYAEVIFEYRGEFRTQRKTNSLHIIDAHTLGNEDVSQKHLQDRYEAAKLFAEALWKPENSENMRVRAKELHPLANNLEERLNLKSYLMKDGNKTLAHVPSSSQTNYDYDGDEPYRIVPHSIIFLKGTAQNWSRHMSRTYGCPYYFNCKNDQKLYEAPLEANASFPETFVKRVIWHWPPDPALTIEDLFRIIGTKCLPPKTIKPK